MKKEPVHGKITKHLHTLPTRFVSGICQTVVVEIGQVIGRCDPKCAINVLMGQGAVLEMSARVSETAFVELLFAPEYDPVAKLAVTQFPQLG